MFGRIATVYNLDVDQLRAVEDGWDGEGAPKPSDGAILRAKDILARLMASYGGAFPYEVEIDADALGGVGIWYRPHANHFVWIACMNSDVTTLVLDDGRHIESVVWDEGSLEKVLAFSRGTKGT